MATACAVGYPFGVIGVILSIVILSLLFRKSRTRKAPHDNQTFITEFRVSNPAVFGKNIRDIMRDALMDYLAEKGVKGVHLGVGGDNAGGIRFYEKYGFTMIHDFGKTGKIFAGVPSELLEKRKKQ